MGVNGLINNLSGNNSASPGRLIHVAAFWVDKTNLKIYSSNSSLAVWFCGSVLSCQNKLIKYTAQTLAIYSPNCKAFSVAVTWGDPSYWLHWQERAAQNQHDLAVELQAWRHPGFHSKKNRFKLKKWALYRLYSKYFDFGTTLARRSWQKPLILRTKSNCKARYRWTLSLAWL